MEGMKKQISSSYARYIEFVACFFVDTAEDGPSKLPRHSGLHGRGLLCAEQFATRFASSIYIHLVVHP